MDVLESDGNEKKPFVMQGFHRFLYELIIGCNIAGIASPFANLFNGKPFFESKLVAALWVADIVFAAYFIKVLFARRK